MALVVLSFTGPHFPLLDSRFSGLHLEPYMAMTVTAKRGTAPSLTLRTPRLVGRVADFNSANQISLLSISTYARGVAVG
jgi:hypothetical protein